MMQLRANDYYPLRNDAKLLESVSSTILAQINRHWGGRSNEAKAACISRMLRVWDDPTAIAAMLETLDALDRAALAIIKEHGGVMRVSTLESVLQVYGHTLPQPGKTAGYYRPAGSEYLTSLIKRGWVLLTPRLGSYSPYGDLKYANVSPEETVYTDSRVLQQVTWPAEVQPLSITPAPPVASSSLRRPHQVMLDLLAVMRTLSELPPLTLTKTLSVRHSDYRKFLKRMEWQDLQLIDGWEFVGLGDAVLATWCQLGWLQRTEHMLRLSLTLEQITRQSLTDLVSQLTGAFLDVRNWQEVDPYSFHLGNINAARAMVFHTLRALPDAAQWYAMDVFTVALYERVGQFQMSVPGFNQPRPTTQDPYAQTVWRRAHQAYWMDHMRPFVEATMTSWLYWVGLVEIGTLDAPDHLAFRITDLGRELLFGERALPAEHNEALHAGPAWVVQPNYDLIVYLDAVTPAQLAFLEGHAERRQAEAHTAHYQLTRDSVYRGLEGGTTIEEFLTTLRQGAQMELPQNVEREIRDWAGQREQLTIQKSVRVVEFSSPATHERAMATGLSGTPIGETFVLLAAGAESDTALHAVAGAQTLPRFDYAQPPVKCLYALEDGTLTLSEDTGDLLIRDQIARYAEPVGAMQWRMTAASLAAARRAGVSAAVLLGFLQSRAHGIVPPLLDVLIRNTLGTRDVVQGESVFALRIADKKLYTAITTSPALQPFLLDVPGPDTILIRPDKREAFLAKLDDVGVKLTAQIPTEPRPDWQQIMNDVKTQQRWRGW